MGMPKKEEAVPEHGDELPGREGHANTLQAKRQGMGGHVAPQLHVWREGETDPPVCG